ncbi:cingulin-like isoform X4 [Ptychodera flava]|uniref:cingulin-like isoform X4 n=2 Tax=Ptychodera flava TaxID=63121 RepID=UPI00396A0F7A
MEDVAVKSDASPVIEAKSGAGSIRGTATYYDIDTGKTGTLYSSNNNKKKKPSQTTEKKKKKMDGSEADGEWSEGDNEEELVIGSDEQMMEEYENGSADEEEEVDEDGDEHDDSGTSHEEQQGKGVPSRKVDPADYIMDNIDAELQQIIASTPGLVKIKPTSKEQRQYLTKQGVEFDFDSDNEKSVRSSQRMTSDTGTTDTGLGSGSMADGYGSSDMENGQFETPRTEDTTTDADSEHVRQRLRHVVEAKARGHSNTSSGDGETPSDSQDSEQTISASSSTNKSDNNTSNPSDSTPSTSRVQPNTPVSKSSAPARVKLATVEDVCEEAEDEYSNDIMNLEESMNNFAEYGSEFDDEDLDRHLDAKVEAAVEKLLMKLSDADINPSRYMYIDSPRQGDSTTDREETPREQTSKPPSGSKSSKSSSKLKSTPKKKASKTGSKSSARKADAIPEIYENGISGEREGVTSAPREARSQSPDGTMVAKGVMDPKQGFVPREIARIKKVSRHSDTDSVATEDFENLFRDAMVVDNISEVSGRGKPLTGKPSSFLVRRMGSDTESVITVATDKFEDKFHDIMVKELESVERKPKKNPSPGPSPVKATYIPSQSSPSKLHRSSSNPPTNVTKLKGAVPSKDRSRSVSPPVKSKKYVVLSASQPRSSSPLPVSRPMKKAKSFDDMESVQTEDYMSHYIGSMVHQKIEPLPAYGGRSKHGLLGSDAESVMTEDYENSFRQMVVKQVAGVPITSFEDVYIASDLDSIKTGEIHKAIGHDDGSNYQSESDLDSDKMEEIERKFQAIIKKKKETAQKSEARPSSTPPPKAKTSAKTPTKRNPRKSTPSRKPGVSRSAERISFPRERYNGSQSFNGTRHHHDDEDLDESLVQKVEALINKQKGRLTVSPRTLSASMPDVSSSRLSGHDLHLDETPMYTSHSQSLRSPPPSQLHDLDSHVRDAKAKKEIALKELNILHEALRRNKIDARQAEMTAKDFYQKAESLKSELMVLEFQRDHASRELKDLEEEIESKKRTVAQMEVTPPKTEAKDDSGMTAAEILSIVKERDDLRTRVRNGEGEMSQLERLELERQINNAKEELFNEQKSSRTQIEALQEELEEAKNRLEESENNKQQLAERTATLEIKLQALENDTKKQLVEKEETYDGLKDKLAKEIATVNQEMEHRNRRVLALESDLAEKEMLNRQLQEKLIEMQSHIREEIQAREKAVEERERQMKAFQAEKDMALNNLRDEIDREKERELTEVKNQSERERRDDLAKQEDKIAEQMAEFQQILLTKEEELELTRERLRQQEDATRNLGEKMREEAKEQIKSAIAKEREIWEKEMERHISREQESWEEQAAKNLARLREELEQERQMALSFQNTISTLREEMEAHRQENRAAHREKIDAVTKAREAARKEKQAELDKLREKLTQEKFAEVDTLRLKLREQDDDLIQLRSDVKCHSQKEKELALQSERHERSLIMEINEECKRVAHVTGGTPRKVPVSSSKTADYSPSVNGSPSKSPKLSRSTLRPQVSQALSNLKSTNEELRQHLQATKQELDREKKSTHKIRKEKEADLKRQRVQLERGKAAQMEALRDRLVKEHLEELNKLQKAVSKDDSTLHVELRHKDSELKEIAKNMNQWKEETAQKMARKFEEELNRELDRRMKDQSKALVLAYKTQLAEQQRQIERKDREIRKLTAEKNSSMDSPSQSSDASTIRLMRHLQERVKHLREENMALRRTAQSISFHSDSGTMEDTTPLASSGLENSEVGSVSTYASSKLESRVRKLERQLKDAEGQSRDNKDLLNTKMTEIEKLQSALTHQTKELMKLERAYAKVQSELNSSTVR